ncbi:MAG: SMC-Scp complex subunit ScpB [Ruminiclostridium sp.]|nr:SMC-Scp complex subunit ScpB [Ruminiclostridium sp.]
MELEEGIAVIEAIMFAYGEPISIDKLSEASRIDKDTTAKLVNQLERRYNVQSSGLRIVRLNNTYQIATRPETAPYVKAALDNYRQTPLSQAAMECLAIIAYNQPVTKGFVEQIRGIDSSSVVNTLFDRGLVEEAGRLELPGRPIAYRTTDTFLRCFGIGSLGELPPLPSAEGQMSLEEMDQQELDSFAEQVAEQMGDIDE